MNFQEMLKKIIISLIIIIVLIPFLYWNKIIGLSILILEIVLISLYKKQIIYVKFFLAILLSFYTQWAYFNLSGFLLTHYFSIKELAENINQTKFKSFDVQNNQSDLEKIKIQNKMKQLNFSYATVDSENRSIKFTINGSYWFGTNSTEQPIVFTQYNFFSGTSYPTIVSIESSID